MAVAELLRNDYDLNLKKVYNPSAPVDPTDIVRLQDLTGYAASNLAKYIVQQPHASLPNAQALSALATGLVKNTTTTGVLSIATGDVDYQVPLTFAQGVRRTVNNVTGDYITGIPLGGGGAQTTWTGGTGSGEGLILSTTSHGTKGRLTFGTTIYYEATNRLGINNPTAQQTLHVTNTGDYQIRFGQDAAGAADYDLGRNTVDGLAYLYGLHPTVAGLVVTGTTGERFRIASNGDVTVANMAGAGSSMVKVNASGTLSRGTAGVDFELPLTFSQGVTRTVNAVTGDYVTGKAIGGSGQTTWTGGTGTGEGIILRTTSHGTKGKITIGTSAYDEANQRLGIGTLTPLAPLHSENAGDFQLRLGQSAGSDYDLGRSSSTGLFFLRSNHGSVGGFVIDGGGSERFRVASSGVVTVPNLAGGSAALVKASTAGDLQRATAGTDYEVALTFASGVTRTVNNVTGDYITGKAIGGSGQTTWTGGTGTGEGIILRTTSHGTKGKLTIGTSAYDEANNRLGIGTTSPTAQLHSEAAGNVQLRLGQSSGSDYDLGRNSSSGLFHLTSNHGSVGGFVVDGGGSERLRLASSGFLGIGETSPARMLDLKAASGDFQLRLGHGTASSVNYDIGRNNSDGMLVFYGNQSVNGYVFSGSNGQRMKIDNSGGVTIDGLSGGTAAIVKASTTGLLQRATAGTDYEPGLTFTSGLTRAVNTVTGDYITGLTGNQTWTASTSSAGNLTLRTTSNSSKGDLTVQSANATFSDGANATIAIKTNVANTGAIYGTTGTALHLGANNTTNYVQIGSTGQVVITDLGGGGSAIVKASTSGVLSRASAGVDYEALLTFTSGLTRATNTVTGDYITGKTGNQTWLGSTDSGGTLEIKSTSNATKGKLTLTASQIFLSNAETTFTVPTLILDNTSASGQMGIHFKANGTLRGIVRSDSAGNMNYATNGGSHFFYVGGDAGTGGNPLQILSGNVAVVNTSLFSISGYQTMNQGSPSSSCYFDADVSGSRERVRWQVGGTTISDNGSRSYFEVFPRSGITVGSGVTSSSQIWTTMWLDSTTFTAASGSPVAFAATTLYIESGPTAAGGLTITNQYALWIDAGRSRFDGDGSGYVFEVPGNNPAGAQQEVDMYLKVWVPGTGARYIEMSAFV